MIKFYCTECRRFLNRLQVSKEIEIMEEPIYFCKWCGESVIKVRKVEQALVADYIEYILAKGKREDYE